MCSAHGGRNGRKSRLDSELEARFLRGLTAGVGIAAAAAYAGIGRSTVHVWLERGEKEDAAGITAETSEYVAFLNRVTRTRATVHVQLAAQVIAAASSDTAGDWRAGAWMLERLAPAEFGRHQVTQHEHSPTEHISDELLGGRQPVNVPLETREKIIALLEEAEAGVVESDADEL